MGKFDGILLLSDWDGTFCRGGEIPEENIRAVQYFQENGGLFSIASGRNYAHLKEFFTDFRPNTCVCCFNGALIVSKDGAVIYENLCDESLIGAVNASLSLFPEITNVWLNYPEGECAHVHFTIEEWKAAEKDFGGRRSFYKALLVGENEQEVKAAEDRIRHSQTIAALGYRGVRSWPTGIELLKIENNKGNAIRRIKALTGAKLSIGVGDFGNDSDLLREADIGYAVEGCDSSLLPFADRITRRAEDGAIAGIVEDLDKTF